MALNYAKLFNGRVTPQSWPIPGSTQVANSGGGYSWQVDDWTRFDRFLILGAEGGVVVAGFAGRPGILGGDRVDGTLRSG